MSFGADHVHSIAQKIHFPKYVKARVFVNCSDCILTFIFLDPLLAFVVYTIQIKLECHNEGFVKRLVCLKLYQGKFYCVKVMTSFDHS